MPAMRLAGTAEALANDGKLTPVPILFRYADGVPVVAAVAAGAARAVGDVRVGDILVAIDGAPVADDNAEALDATLAGPPKSTVRLTFERERTDGTSVRLERPVRRVAIDDPAAPATTGLMLSADVGYVRLTTFVGSRIASDLQRTLDSLDRAGMQRLVLDLRDNGGGRVDQASTVAGSFLPAGKVVYTAAGRRSDVTDTGRVERAFWRNPRNVPVAVLINEGTASASELVAGALQDYDRAVIVGRPSFGKALLMRGFPLTDGSVLMLVVGQIRTPCGRAVQREYRGLRAAEYFREAGAAPDTAGRPTCRTTGGRTVYGGGGIYPDVVLAPVPKRPEWWNRLEEEGILERWAAAYAGETGGPGRSLAAYLASPPSPDALVASLRTFAAGAGVTLPEPGADAERFGRRLQAAVAAVTWGEAGAIRVLAPADAEVRAAVAALAARPRAP
jgi:carboxyl-terminal processing protease